MNRRVRFFTILASLLLSIAVQPMRSSAQQFLIHNYENNLPSLEVMGVSQDHDGLMWFATRAGMVRFDGTTWKVDPPSSEKRQQSIRFVDHDSQGRIWSLATSIPFQINSFDDSQWQAHEIPSDKVWGQGVLDFKVTQRADGTVLMAIASGRFLSFWDGKKWHRFGQEKPIKGIRAMDFLGEKLFLATEDGLLKFDPDRMNFFPMHPRGMIDGPIQALVKDQGEEPGLWLVGTDWVGRFQDDRFHLLGQGLDFELSKVVNGTSALAGPSGGLFFGSLEGFFHFHPQRGLLKLDRSNGFISGGISDLFLDREQNIWVTSPRGISKLVSMRMETYNSRFGLAFDEVSAIVQRADGSMVLGHEGGLTFLDPDPEVLLINRDLPGTGRVMDMATDPQGRIWIAFDQWGLALLNEDRTLQWFGTDDGLPDFVFSLHFDQKGELWVGGSRGLYRKAGNRFKFVPLLNYDPGTQTFVRRINEGLDGSLLVSTGSFGVFKLLDGVVQWNSESSDNMVKSCYQVLDHGQGHYWVATSAGLCRRRGGVIELTTSPEPEIRRPIYCILKDDQGRFWFGTDNGLLRWDGSQLITINNHDGLLGREFNRDALMQANDGRIWMGTDRGLSVYDHRFDHPRTAKPLVEIQAPFADGVVVELDEQLELESSLYELVFPFRGLSFLDENRIMFRTWLEGLEPQWQPYQDYPTRRIRYTNLPSGQYRFHVQARNVAGQESNQASSEYFQVKEHFAQAWWFILLEISGGLVLALGVLFLLIGRRYQQQLKKEVQQRTRELRLSEQAVRSESRRLFAVLASISDGVLALDHDLRVVISNPMVLSILGVRLDEVIGRKLGKILTVEPALMIDEKPDPLENPGIPVYQFTEKDGQHRFLEISVAPMVVGAGSPTGWVLAFRDVTERQNHEKEMIRTQQLESLGVLAGGIAHDFNNLLTIMLGNLSLVESADSFGEDEKNRLERMKLATIRAQGLAEQLLTFAKGGDPVLQAVDLEALVEQSTSFALSGAKVSSRIHVEDDLWSVSGDPGQLGQVVNNLVINAMQAMPAGGIMELELKNLHSMPGSARGTSCVCLSVLDQGDGIDPDNLNRIFNPYFTTKGTGSGLGLTIAHSIVAHHGGVIQAESQPGKGTALRVYLPAVVSSPKEFENNISRSFPVGLRVLILDDEKELLLLAEQMLRRLGIKCVGVSDGEAAVQAFARAMGQNKSFSVFIADLTIPGGVGGVEAFKKIRAMDQSVRGIVISGYSNDKVMANFEQYGFSAAVRKPFEQDQLIASLVKALKGFRD